MLVVRGQNVSVLRLLRPHPGGANRYQDCSRRLFSQYHRLQEQPSRTRNIGIIAHIDAGKTTTTERMLYYSGHTTRLGDVDEGSTVTDFLPAERARGITIQSAAITFHWPPSAGGNAASSPAFPYSQSRHDINLIDTPGHADFTFEVMRSLRVLDGAVCILDGVAGVEAQTEIVWAQANQHRIPRLVFVNKLDRTGAAFARTVREVALKLHVWPAVCQIPWWRQGDKQFCGVGDAVNLRSMRWSEGTDGRAIESQTLAELEKSEPEFAEELKKARVALVELLSEHDDLIVEHFFEHDEDHLAIPSTVILESLRRCTLQSPQRITPLFAGASFRNIGVQPLLDAVVDLLPSPKEIPDPKVTVAGSEGTLSELLAGKLSLSVKSKNKTASVSLTKLQVCALAFKVVNDAKRGVLVYVRVYQGQLKQASPLWNTTLGVGERANRVLRMYADDAVDIEGIDAGHIGVIIGLKQTRTGDTLVGYTGTNPKNGPPVPLNTLQLQPIPVPPPVFFASVEPYSLSEQKQVLASLDILLREDPSLHVSTDPESGQTHLSGMGELHLEIACDRLIKDLKAKATVGDIEIGYRESIAAHSGDHDADINREIGGKLTRAAARASVEPNDGSMTAPPLSYADDTEQHFLLEDANVLTISHPLLTITGKPTDPDTTPVSLPASLPLPTIITAIRAGVSAALARGPAHFLPVHATHVRVSLDPRAHIAAESTPGAIALATRTAVLKALAKAGKIANPVVYEPVMAVNIDVHESDLGAVVHDITAARGGQVLSLGDDDGHSSSDNSDNSNTTTSATTNPDRTELDIRRVYTPPDPFGLTLHSSAASDTTSASAASAATMAQRRRRIVARVPLKEMVGYLKHLRSLTGGRGTFLMAVDRFEAVRGARLKRLQGQLRGEV